MKVAYFIASRLVKKGNVSTNQGEKGLRAIIKIAIAGIAIGMIVMITSLAIVSGFQKEIRTKVIGFGSHIQVTAFNVLATNTQRPIDKNQEFVSKLLKEKGVKNIQVFATKEGIIKTDEELHGIVVKGVAEDFDWAFFNQNLVKGKPLKINSTTTSDSILISENIANKLRLNVGEAVIVYFVQKEKSRPRKFIVSGIYQTGLEQFDNVYILADIKHIQKLNDWSSNLVSGFEILLTNFNDLEKLDDYIYNYINHELVTVKITDLNRDIFGWIELQDLNVIIIIVLIILVSAINMSSALLILILERTGFIGLLKSIGATNFTIRKIFLYNAAYLIIVGLFWGNIIGLALCYIQKYFKIFKLKPETYYMDYVPIELNILTIILLNIGTIVLCTILLIIPSYVITKISPVKALKFN